MSESVLVRSAVGAAPMHTTMRLIRRTIGGDGDAREQLARRFLPMLSRWARGRMPPQVGESVETQDLVQISLLRALDRLNDFEIRAKGGFFGYLRKSFVNAVRDELRRQRRTSGAAHEGDWLLGPVAEIVGPERLAIYHQTLAGLTRSEQELVLMRFEFGLSFAEMALEVGSTAEAVRKRLARILLSMAMSHGVEHEKSS